MVQSSPLFSNTFSMPDASATTPGKNNLPRRYAGGMIASLNRKATDSTTTRLTPARGMELVSATANCRKRFASPFAMGTRGPKADKTASCPLITGSSSAASKRFPSLTLIRSRNDLSRSGERTNAVTECPYSIACRTISNPVLPVAPNTTSFILPRFPQRLAQNASYRRSVRRPAIHGSFHFDVQVLHYLGRIEADLLESLGCTFLRVLECLFVLPDRRRHHVVAALAVFLFVNETLHKSGQYPKKSRGLMYLFKKSLLRFFGYDELVD